MDDVGSIPCFGSPDLQKLRFVDTVSCLCPSQLMTHLMALIAAHLNAKIFLVVTM